ncbi:hypothetical protein ABBQ38_011369 [Trebouxia sp. C0009 RCD-2024]
MVVLAASIVTKTGKALVSRQYVDMSRIRIEGLLAAFPKLIGSGRQHTYVETENVRYVYQPLELLHLLVVTNKSSNILEDLEILRLLAKIVPDYAQSLDEEGITKAAFDLLFAFDEVISLGYKENVTLQQVRQNTEMESHEEKLYKMIIQSKRQEAIQNMRQKAQEIDRAKMESAKAGRGMPAYAPSPSMGSRAMDLDNTPTYMSQTVPTAFSTGRPTDAAGKPAKKGMQLGKAKKANDFLDSLRAEGEVMNNVEAAPAAAGVAAPLVVPSEPVSIVVDEKLMVVLNKDGGVESMEVNGGMALQVLNEEDSRLKVSISAGQNTGFQMKTHPNIDKALYSSQSVLGLKDPQKPFPAGSPLGILKWRMQTTDESMVPLLINCWPSASGGESYVNIEYESTTDFDLQNVAIAIPLPALSASPKVNQIDGDWRYDARKSIMLWSIDIIDAGNRTGSLEFVVPNTRPETFFPVTVNFNATRTLCQVEVADVISLETGHPIKYALRTQLQTDGYEVV